MLRSMLIAIGLLGACSKAPPPEGTSLLEKTKHAVDAVCACGADAACKTRETAKYEALVAEAAGSGTTNVSAEVLDQLAKQTERIAQCSAAK